MALAFVQHGKVNDLWQAYSAQVLSYSARFAGTSGSDAKYFVRFQKQFLERSHLRHCGRVNINSCLFLKTRAIALVLKKREVLLNFKT